jgi:hypothetical protein
MSKAIIISDSDNVATMLAENPVGTMIELIDKQGGKLPAIKALEIIPNGNKIALRDLEPGEHMIKYGEACGLVYARIAKGELVHVHNVKSERINIPDEIVEDILREMHYTRRGGT